MSFGRSIIPVLLMASCLLAAGSEPATRYGPILNTNGEFEQGATAYYFTRPKQMTLDQEEVYRGFTSLRIQGENTTAAAEDTILVQGFGRGSSEKRDYQLSVAVKARGITTELPFRAQVAGSYGKGKPSYEMPLQERITIGQDCDWKVFKMILRDVPADVGNLHLWFVLPHQSAATVWIDSIEVREIVK